MRKVSAGKNDLQKIENKFLENLVKSGPARSWRPGNKIMAPGEIQNAQSISRKKMICKKLKTNLGQKFLGENLNRHRQIQNAQSISRKKNDLQKIENKFVGLAGRYPKTSR